MQLEPRHLEYLQNARVARLGTINRDRTAHVIPIVFANDKNRIYFVVDRKSKGKTTLRRIANLQREGNGTIIIDHYSENWSGLSFLLLYCDAEVVHRKEEKQWASKLLKKKYVQYSKGKYFPRDTHKAVFVSLSPKRAIFWQNLHRSLD